MAERARDRDRLAFATFADRRRPDGELQVGREVARPRLSERDLDLAGLRVGRRRAALELPHAADDTARPLTPSSQIRPSPNSKPHLRNDRIGHAAPHQGDRTAALIHKSQLNLVGGLASARKPSSTGSELLELADLVAELAGREQAKLLRQDRRWTLGKREQVIGNL